MFNSKTHGQQIKSLKNRLKNLKVSVDHLEKISSTLEFSTNEAKNLLSIQSEAIEKIQTLDPEKINIKGKIY